MEDKDFTKLVDSLKEAITIQVQEQVYLQTLSKDKEISGLHREIRDDIKGLKTLVQGHDEVIQELRQLYKTSGYIKKFILWFLIFVPSIATFIAGVKYIYNLTQN